MTNSNDASNPYTAPKSSVEPGVGEIMVACKGCSKDIHIFASTCPHCGLSQRSRPYKNKNIAGLLAMILGAFGVHRFYMGQWWGVFYLLLFWTGIPSIISFFEAIVFWCSNVNSWDAKHNEGRPASPNEQSGAGTIILIVISFLVVGFAVVGILAAIAIPAYHDYTIRARVSEVLIDARDYEAGIRQYYEQNNTLPTSADEIGIESNSVPSGYLAEITDSGFTITYTEESVPELYEKTIEFKAYLDDGQFAWDCTGGSVLNRHRLSRCRDSSSDLSSE